MCVPFPHFTALPSLYGHSQSVCTYIQYIRMSLYPCLRTYIYTHMHMHMHMHMHTTQHNTTHTHAYTQFVTMLLTLRPWATKWQRVCWKRCVCVCLSVCARTYVHKHACACIVFGGCNVYLTYFACPVTNMCSHSSLSLVPPTPFPPPPPLP